MEKRLILAIVLSFVILFAYQAVFMKKKPQTEVVQPIAAEALQKPEQKAPEITVPAAPSAEQTPQEKTVSQPVASQKEEEISIDSSLYHAVWSNKGGVLKSWKIKKHTDENKEALELVSKSAADTGKYPFCLWTEDLAFNDAVNGVFYKSSGSSLQLKDGEKGEIRFEYSDGKDTKIEKTFIFLGGTYDFEVRIEAWKNGQKMDPNIVWGPGIGNPSPEELKRRVGGAAGGIAVLAADKVYRVNERKYNPQQSAFNFVSWAAFEDNYFAAVFLMPTQKGTAAFLQETKDKLAYFYVAAAHPQRVFIGPKEFDVLLKLGQNTKQLMNFGFFGAIAEILLRAIKFIHKAIPNWGMAIIILTFLIKIVFFPLTYSSTKSMAKMQELQPKIKALRAKYKKAKQDIGQRRQMNEEMMRLYKEHGINPAGGCLPLLIQIPVFWGFFRMLTVGIEFRQAPFMLWIRDLSIKDPFYVTPILMGLTQYISQKMTPTSADPTQAKMMLIMPFIFTIFFMNFQSGLVLYWLTNNVLQIGQQAIMNRMMAKKKKEDHGKRRKD